MRPRFLAFAAVVLALAAAPARAQAPEQADVRLAVGGKSLIYYLPLTITERLGYFKDAGLNVEISDFQGGSKSLQALMGGSVDVATGSFEHTIQMQAKGQDITALVMLGRFPGVALGVLDPDDYEGPQSLEGMTIGVTAPGSSTNFMVNYLMAKNGLDPEEASFVGVGGGATAVAAAKRGEIDAIANLDPVIIQLERQKLIKVVYDTRTPEGAKAVYGGVYPAAVLYTRPSFAEDNPNTAQALVGAFVRGLRWINGATPEAIVAAMPEEYKLGDPDAYLETVRKSKAIFAHDGRVPEEGPKNVLNVLGRFDATTKGATIDLKKTYDNRFVEAAARR